MKRERQEYTPDARCWIGAIRSTIKVRTLSFGEKNELNFLNVTGN